MDSDGVRADRPAFLLAVTTSLGGLPGDAITSLEVLGLVETLPRAAAWGSWETRTHRGASRVSPWSGADGPQQCEEQRRTHGSPWALTP